MYFITNSERYIVAASKEFLEKSGSRDLCAIASSLKDGTITLESDNSLFKASNFSEELNFESTKLFSAFGTLTLYTLNEIIEEPERNEEDESINYLKQLREGVIKKDDHEFSIPTISTIQKSETAAVKETTANLEETKAAVAQESEEKESEVISLETQSETEVTESLQAPTEKEIQVETPALKEESYETIKLFGNHQEEQKSQEPKTAATTEVVKLKEYGSEDTDSQSRNISEEALVIKEEKSQESAPADEIEESLEIKEPIALKEQEDSESFDIKPLDEEQLVIKDEKPIEKVEQIEKVAEVPTGSQEEQEVESKGLNRLKEKLFPWGSKLEENIELEEAHSEKLITTASDLLETEKSKELIESKETIAEETIEKVAKKEPIYSETVENIVEEDEVTLPVIDTEKESIAELEEPKEEESQKVHQETEPTLEELELAELKQMHEERLATKEPESVVTEAAKPEQSMEALKLAEEAVVVPQEEQSQKTVSTESSKLYYKLIQMQVAGVNLEKNAKNLSIDLDSYKMLLGNYLDELENYREDLENRSDSTISMLEDASELLSLSPVSKKLKELRDSQSDHKSILRDITLFESLLREKLGEKKSTEKKSTEKESSKVEEPAKPAEVSPTMEEVQEPIVEESNLPVQEVITIDSAQSLLEKLESKSVSFDPNEAANDLNLPVTLILEFVDDFIDQAKEHLSQMVKAYKESDIKTLQTTAHMLKGAASNLRLDSVSDTLFNLQKLQSMEKAEELLKEFVSKLKGLEHEVESYESNK
jgi:HPt (histidine-containing phosphotransfer) domain-containing protein